MLDIECGAKNDISQDDAIRNVTKSDDGTEPDTYIHRIRHHCQFLLHMSEQLDQPVSMR
jgi:hypothetical protein